MADDLMKGFTSPARARFVIELDARTNRHHLFDMGDKGRHLILVSDYPLYGVRDLLNEQDTTITQLRENIQHLRTELVGHQLRVEKLEAIETRARLVRDRQLGGRTGIAITQEMNYVLGENKP